jgi:hypothetical protein
LAVAASVEVLLVVTPVDEVVDEELETREFVVARRRRGGTLKVPVEEEVVVAKARREEVERLEELRLREMRSTMAGRLRRRGLWFSLLVVAEEGGSSASSSEEPWSVAGMTVDELRGSSRRLERDSRMSPM